MTLCSFQRSVTVIVPLDSQFKCLISSLGKTDEPHFTSWNIFFQIVYPIFSTESFQDLLRPQSWNLTSGSSVPILCKVVTQDPLCVNKCRSQFLTGWSAEQAFCSQRLPVILEP